MNEKKLNDKEKIEAILEKFQLNLAEFSRNIDVKLDTIYSIFWNVSFHCVLEMVYSFSSVSR